MGADATPCDSDLWMLIKEMRSEMLHLTKQREEDRQRSFELASRNKSLEGEVQRLRSILETPSQGCRYMNSHDTSDGSDDDDQRYLYGATVRQRAQFWEKWKNTSPERK